MSIIKGLYRSIYMPCPTILSLFLFLRKWLMLRPNPAAAHVFTVHSSLLSFFFFLTSTLIQTSADIYKNRFFFLRPSCSAARRRARRGCRPGNAQLFNTIKASLNEKISYLILNPKSYTSNLIY